MLPVLQWVDNPVQDVQKITRINYDIPPQSTIESWFYRSTEECNATRYDKLMFSCTQQPYGDSLDSWLENYQVTNGLRSMATESFMTFEMNRTEAVESDEGLSPKHVDALLASWVPSRQVIASLNEDLQFVEDSAGNPSAEGERYDLNSRTLGLELRRNGPILGAITGRYLDYAPWPGKFIINVDQKRTVICYRGYDFRWVSGELLTNFTKCTRNGGGWNASLSEDATTCMCLMQQECLLPPVSRAPSIYDSCRLEY